MSAPGLLVNIAQNYIQIYRDVENHGEGKASTSQMSSRATHKKGKINKDPASKTS
jgi:hypothetical protein